jgi:hypothetical protein
MARLYIAAIAQAIWRGEKADRQLGPFPGDWWATNEKSAGHEPGAFEVGMLAAS